MVAILILHGVVAGCAPWVHARVGRRVFLWCAIAPAAACVWAAAHASEVLDGEAVTQSISWVPQLGLALSFRMDAFALLMVALVSGIGVVVFWYCASYFTGDERKLGIFSAQLTAFSGAMLGLVLADNVLLLFVFWELTAVTSYFLIGFEDEKGSARAAARQAILTTSAGGLALLAGLILLSQAAGTASMHEILSSPPSGGTTTAALVLVVVGAATKSAQAPFHSWLPAAMVAPTPVSAYLHSATMVKAGVYIIARFAPPFASNGVWRPLVVSIGLVTMLIGGYRALRQHDLKLLLAFGTVAQLGFLFILFGTGSPTATKAGAALLLAHGLFKATLFLTVGIIDHQAHTRDVRLLDGLSRRMPAVAVAATVAAASMAGLPPFLGFIAKELAFDAYLHGALGGVADAVVLTVLVIGSALTFAYSARFVWGAFARKEPSPGAPLVGADVARPAASFVAPVAVLAGLIAVLGVRPSLVTSLVVDAAAALDNAVSTSGLVLWHGWSGALAISLLTTFLGATLVWQRRRVERSQAAAPSLPRSDAAYRASLDWLNRVADRVTGIVQNGSLPVYLAVIVVTVLAVPGVALLFAAHWPERVRLAESPLQGLVAALVIASAVATAAARRRFVAALLVGAVGYGIAGLYVIQGAPDLALTQLLVETLTIVVFVLVLRHLPERFPTRSWKAIDIGRGVIALGVGAFVTLFTIVAASARREAPVADGLVDRAVPRGGGRNVVNVILTDFRALDTLGEISVLAVAALGVTSLLVVGRRDRALRRTDDEESTS